MYEKYLIGEGVNFDKNYCGSVFEQTSQLVCLGSKCTNNGSQQVWGSNPFTFDSNACKAGQHAGVINSNGGIAQIKNINFKNNYPGSTQNGIVSAPWS